MDQFVPLRHLEQLQACGRCHAPAIQVRTDSGCWRGVCSEVCTVGTGVEAADLAAAAIAWNRWTVRAQAEIRTMFCPWWQRWVRRCWLYLGQRLAQGR